MAEKGELPPDQVSLPPNYAPSEAYTESPPPAYSTKKSSVVAVTRMVCLTILAGAFMIGFFSITHSWLQARSCNCQHDDHDHIKSASFVEFPQAPQVAALVAHKETEASENTIITDMNNNVSELKDALSEQDVQKSENSQSLETDDILPTIDEEVSSLQQEVNILDQVEAEIEDERQILEDSVQQEIDDVKKKIKIPMDVILGNPSLSGRDVNCEVERRQQDIGGLMTQAIIVTCNDKDDGPSNPLGMPLLSSPSSQRPIGPPLSLLGPIMKMITAKAKQRAEEMNSMRSNTPERIDGPRPVIMSSPISGPLGGPIRIIRGPMPGPMSGPSPFPMPGPRFLPIRGPIMSGPRHPIPDMNSSPMPNFNENKKSVEGRQPKMIPMSIRPTRISNGRSIRVLPFSKERRVDSFLNLPNDLPPFPKLPSPFPFKNEQEMRNLPEPQPRGLNSPIALPGLRLLPGRILNIYPQPTSAVRLAERAELPKPITHMEMRQPEHKFKPIAIHNFKPEGPEFGPPKVHTVIGPPKNLPQFKRIPPPKALPELPPVPPHFFNSPKPTFPPTPLHPTFPAAPVHPTFPPAPVHPTFAPAPLHPTFPPAPLHSEFTSPPAPLRTEPSPPAPPHPKINPEGLTGIVPDINPDAEVVEPMGDHASTAPTPRKHHLLKLN